MDKSIASFILSLCVISNIWINVVQAALDCNDPDTTCVGFPGFCGSDWNSCEVLAKLKSTGRHVEVDLIGKKSSANNLDFGAGKRWIAVGFSKSGSMPDAAVVHCFRDTKGKMQSKLTYNAKEDDGFFNDGWNGIKQDQITPAALSSDANSIRCSVKLNKDLSINEDQFNLAEEHTLILATGRLGRSDSIGKHDKRPVTVEETKAFY